MPKKKIGEAVLLLAIGRLQMGKGKIVRPGTVFSISAVAREAGCNPSTIHSGYPKVIAKIRDIQKKNSVGSNNRKLENSVNVLEELRALRRENDRLKRALSSSQSLYQSVRIRLESLEPQSGKSNGKVVELKRAKFPQ